MSYPRIARFRSVAELRDHLAALHAPIPLDDAPLAAAAGSPLAKPLVLGGRTVGNRCPSAEISRDTAVSDSGTVIENRPSSSLTTGDVSAAPYRPPDPLHSPAELTSAPGIGRPDGSRRRPRMSRAVDRFVGAASRNSGRPSLSGTAWRPREGGRPGGHRRS